MWCQAGGSKPADGAVFKTGSRRRPEARAGGGKRTARCACIGPWGSGRIRLSDLDDVRGFFSPLAGLHFEFHLLPFVERTESAALDVGMVHVELLCTFGRD